MSAYLSSTDPEADDSRLPLVNDTPTAVAMVVHSDYIHDYRVRREAEALQQTGLSVRVIAASVAPEARAPFELNGVEVHPVALRRSGGKLRYLEMMRAVRQILAHTATDIIHAHDLDALIATAKIAKNRGNVLIYDSHELHTEVHSLQNRRLTRSIWRHYEKKYIPYADYIITVSQGIAEELQRRYELLYTPYVIRNFTDIQSESSPAPEFLNTSEELRRQLPKTSKLALYQGILQNGRGLEMMIEAIAAEPDWGLVICGDGPIREILERGVRELHAEDRIYFTGMISRELLAAITPHCDVGLLLTEPLGLSHYYSLPNKLSEYIHAGLPIIATELPEITRIIRQYKIGCTLPINAFTPEQVRRGLAYITEHSERLRRHLPAAAEELNWAREKKILQNLYYLISSRRKPV
ncbi:MAG: glycosyltransferase [Cyclonatronaceae bacterium]